MKRHEKVNFGDVLCKEWEKGNRACFGGNVKKGIRPNMCGSAVRVGEAVNDSDILAMWPWRDHFSSIINSECPQKREDQLRFERALREQMSRPQLPWWCVEINVSEVSKAVSRLN